jgi:hypothetical protein
VTLLFVLLLSSPGLPAPTHAFFSAMPGPLTPQQQRPWRQQRHLDEEQFKVMPAASFGSGDRMLVHIPACFITMALCNASAVKLSMEVALQVLGSHSSTIVLTRWSPAYRRVTQQQPLHARLGGG